MNTIEHCNGCIAGCILFDHYNNGDCPCSECVVKPMCDNRCNDFNVFIKSMTMILLREK